MNGLQQLGQLAGDTVYALAYACEAALAVCALFSVAGMIRAALGRMRRRRTPAPRVRPVGYTDGIPRDGDPLKPAEAQAYAVIVRHLKGDARRRAARRRGRTVRRVIERAGWR